MPLPNVNQAPDVPTATIGDGVQHHGMYDVGPGLPLHTLVTELQHSYGAVCLLGGDYQVEGPVHIVTPGFRLYGVGRPILSIGHGGPVGLLDVAPTVDGVQADGLTITSPTTNPGQSILRFGVHGADHTVARCRFLIHPSTLYTGPVEGEPMRLIDMQGVAGKNIVNNTFLPYSNVVPIWLENGSGGLVDGNRIHNGLTMDLDSLVTFQRFPYVRPCRTPIYLRNERQGWVSRNLVWAVGDPTHGEQVTAGIQYDFVAGATPQECGHMEFSGNKVELCHGPRAIWLRGAQYSTVLNNNTGVSTNNALRLENAVGTGALVVEPGLGGEASRFNTIQGNNFHNPGKLNTDASAIYLRGVESTAVLGNHVANLFNRLGLLVDQGCRDVAVRGLVVHFNQAAANNFAAEIRGDADGTTVGEVSGHRVDSGGNPSMVNNLSTGTSLVAGLGRLGPGVSTAPHVLDTPDVLSTNLRVSG